MFNWLAVRVGGNTGKKGGVYKQNKTQTKIQTVLVCIDFFLASVCMCVCVCVCVCVWVWVCIVKGIVTVLASSAGLNKNSYSSQKRRYAGLNGTEGGRVGKEDGGIERERGREEGR